MNPRTDTDLDNLEAKHLKQNPKGSLGMSPSIERLDHPSPRVDVGEKSGPKAWAESAKGALHDAAGGISEFSSKQAHHLAEGKDEVAGYFRSHSSDEIKADARRITREHPGAVLGSLVALGFVLGLALRPSSH